MAAFRRARGLSYRSLSERLARELGVTASADTLRRLEQGLAGLGWWDEAHAVDRNWIPTTAERAMIVRDYAIAQLEATFEIKRGSIRRWTQRR